MRMWMCNPKILCQKHLCGEHLEMHMFLGALKKRKKVDGYLKNNLLEPLKLAKRHDELSEEMTNRGYNHKSPFGKFNECGEITCLPPYQRIWTIDKKSALKDLLDRCPECRKRFTSFECQPLANT